MARILAIGTATLDLIFTLTRYPDEDAELRAKGLRFSPGGNAPPIPWLSSVNWVMHALLAACWRMARRPLQSLNTWPVTESTSPPTAAYLADRRPHAFY